MDDLETSIYVAIRTARTSIRRGISAKIATDGDEATARLSALIASALRTTYDIDRKSADATKLPKTF